MAVIEKDKLLWCILAIIGINLSNYRLSRREKFLSLFIIVLNCILALHWVSATMFFIISHRAFDHLPYLSLIVQIALTIGFLNAKKNRITHIVQKLYIYRKEYINEDNRSYMTNILIIIMIFSPVLISVFLLTSVPQPKLKVDFWSFKSQIEGNFYRDSFLFYCYFIHYASGVMVLFVTFSLCTIFYRWGEVLNSYNMLLKLHLREKTQMKTVEILKDFFNIVDTLQKLDLAVSYPSFFIIFYALGMVFLSLYAIVLSRKVFLEEPAYFVEFTFNGLCGFLIVFMYSLSSSVIPQRIVEIKKTAKKYINRLGENSLHFQLLTFYLRRIEMEDTVYISACGLFYFTRQFILTAIGVTLTYDLLIIKF